MNSTKIIKFESPAVGPLLSLYNLVAVSVNLKRMEYRRGHCQEFFSKEGQPENLLTDLWSIHIRLFVLISLEYSR